MAQKHPKTTKITAIIVLIGCLILPGLNSRALANELGTNLELTLVPAASVAGVALAGYMLWKNRLSQPPDAKGILGYHGPGEFYFGAYAGASLVNTADWSFEPMVLSPGNERNATAKNVRTDPGPAGGLKVGYFFDSCPYLGFEGEGSLASNNRPRQQVTVKPGVSASPTYTESQGNLIWTMALHIVGRYGFLRDKEVPFGRLQPYVGIGPGLAMLYFQSDSAKNFSLDTEVGLRYMFTKNIGAFVEFKYIKQWDVQLGVQHLFSNGQRFDTGGAGDGKNVHFDFDNQKIVVGLEYHF